MVAWRDVGQTGLKVSPLCMGTMSFGNQADAATSAAMFYRCREVGINHFDTADIYAGGRSEEILGELIAGCRDEIVLASKAYFPTGEGPNDRGASRYHLVRALEASLRRLGTDRLDIYYIHRFDERTALDDVLRTIDDLVRAGKILYPALSNFAAWQVSKALGLAALHGFAKPVCIQPMYNLVKRQAEVEILPMARSEALGVFPYSPLGAGLLSGKYVAQQTPGTGRLVDDVRYRARYGVDDYAETARRFVAIARELGHHPVTLAIAWVKAHPAVTAPILGARNLDQLEPALAAIDLELDAETYARLGALSPEPAPATDRLEERSAHTLDHR